MNKNFKESSKSGSIAWLLQRISAVYLFIALVGHFIFYHFIRQGNIAKADILKYTRYSWFSVLQFLFLISALYHGLNGIWIVVEDYIHTKYLRIALFSLIIIVGIALLFVGTLTIVRISSPN
jgi:succinate dehydrogenase / fumarate reductase membrane anchor subunit